MNLYNPIIHIVKIIRNGYTLELCHLVQLIDLSCLYINVNVNMIKLMLM